MMICSLTAPGSGRTTGAGKIVASQRRLFQSAFHLRLQSLPCPVAVTSTRGWTELSRERSRLIEDRKDRLVSAPPPRTVQADFPHTALQSVVYVWLPRRGLTGQFM